MDEFRRRGVRIVAVSVDPPADAERMRSSAGAEFEFLSDPEGRLIDLFGLRHHGGGPGGDIAQTASFLLDAGGRLAWMRVAKNYRVRPRPGEILAAVDRLPGAASGPRDPSG